MIPAVANRGTSFKGAGLYYLHDKKRDGELSRSTNERVAWTEKRNLLADDPDFNLRVMAATAMNKDKLKEDAGIRKGGRQSKGDVYSYSLAWHPDEKGKIDRAEMLSAVDQSIKAIGAQDHQAVIVCHKDEPHPHVHVVLNIVNPHNGKNLLLSNDYKKLEKWAHEYRKQRGEEQIYCPHRTKKMETIEARNRGDKVPFIRGKGESRALYESFEDIRKQVPANDVTYVKEDQAKKDAELSSDGRKMESKHSYQWEALSDNYQLRKNNITRQYWNEKKELQGDVKEEMKPAFRELFKQQWRERTAFEQREKRLTGKLKNIHEAIKYAKEIRGEENSYIFSSIFNYFAAAGKRTAWLNAKHSKQVNELRGYEKTLLKNGISQLNATRLTRYSGARQDFQIERNALIGRQKLEKSDFAHRWRMRIKQRARALEALAVKGSVKPADENLLVQGDKITAKRKFQERAEKSEGKTRTQGRKRKRTRKD